MSLLDCLGMGLDLYTRGQASQLQLIDQMFEYFGTQLDLEILKLASITLNP